MTEKCSRCRYYYICAGLTGEVREHCPDFTESDPQQDWINETSTYWNEMSYNRRSARQNTPSMQQRLRDGE